MKKLPPKKLCRNKTKQQQYTTWPCCKKPYGKNYGANLNHNYNRTLNWSVGIAGW